MKKPLLHYFWPISGFSYSGIYSNPYWNVLHAFPGSHKELHCKLISFPPTSEKSKNQILNYGNFIHKKQKMHRCFYNVHYCVFSFSLETSHLEHFLNSQSLKGNHWYLTHLSFARGMLIIILEWSVKTIMAFTKLNLNKNDGNNLRLMWYGMSNRSQNRREIIKHCIYLNVNHHPLK